MKAYSIRTALRPGDVGAVVAMHGRLYAREYGFDPTFEGYVAAPLAEFVQRSSERERIWLAESEGRLVGSIAIAAGSASRALLRWFLVDPEARALGLGTTLLRHAVEFSRANGYDSIELWTVSSLTAAARLYRAAGFRLLEEIPARRWGSTSSSSATGWNFVRHRVLLAGATGLVGGEILDNLALRLER
jgi:GNAT superfamily N-acetyltransferase